jgi:CDP-glucose 4,6-dehydratase
VVDAYLRLAEASGSKGIQGEAFNFSHETRISVLEITQTILRLMGREDLQPVIQSEAKDEIRDQYLDSTKAKDRLGWSSSHDLEAGLRKTIPWYQAFLDSQA